MICLICMPSGLQPSTYISGKSLMPMLQLLYMYYILYTLTIIISNIGPTKAHIVPSTSDNQQLQVSDKKHYYKIC